MLRKPRDVNAKSMTSAIGGQAVRLVRACEHEGLARERRRPIEGLAVERMASPAIDPMNFVEQKIVFEVGAQHLRRRHADIDLVAKKRRSEERRVGKESKAEWA